MDVKATRSQGCATHVHRRNGLTLFDPKCDSDKSRKDEDLEISKLGQLHF